MFLTVTGVWFWWFGFGPVWFWVWFPLIIILFQISGNFAGFLVFVSRSGAPCSCVVGLGGLGGVVLLWVFWLLVFSGVVCCFWLVSVGFSVGYL